MSNVIPLHRQPWARLDTLIVTTCNGNPRIRASFHRHRARMEIEGFAGDRLDARAFVAALIERT